MPRTVILSEETVRALLQANASLAAWYHEFVRASREQSPVGTPGDATRKAFLDRLGTEFPELAGVIAQIGVPPVYAPPPLAFAPQSVGAPSTQLPSTQLPSTQMPASQLPATQMPGTQPSDGAARPPMVNPRLVKY